MILWGYVLIWYSCGDSRAADEKSPVIKGFCGFGTKIDVCFKFPQSSCEETDLPRGIGVEWSESYLLAKQSGIILGWNVMLARVLHLALIWDRKCVTGPKERVPLLALFF